jgi:hypothetical protein
MVAASVRPERVGTSSPFAPATGANMLIDFELDVLPGLTIVARRPDLKSTAYGLLADFINAVREGE